MADDYSQLSFGEDVPSSPGFEEIPIEQHLGLPTFNERDIPIEQRNLDLGSVDIPNLATSPALGSGASRSTSFLEGSTSSESQNSAVSNSTAGSTSTPEWVQQPSAYSGDGFGDFQNALGMNNLQHQSVATQQVLGQTLRDKMGNLGQGERASINDKYNTLNENVQGNMAGRGLSGSSLTTTGRLDVESQRQQEMGALEDKLLGQRMAAETDVAKGISDTLFGSSDQSTGLMGSLLGSGGMGQRDIGTSLLQSMNQSANSSAGTGSSSGGGSAGGGSTGGGSTQRTASQQALDRAQADAAYANSANQAKKTQIQYSENQRMYDAYNAETQRNNYNESQANKPDYNGPATTDNPAGGGGGGGGGGPSGPGNSNNLGKQGSLGPPDGKTNKDGSPLKPSGDVDTWEDDEGNKFLYLTPDGGIIEDEAHFEANKAAIEGADAQTYVMWSGNSSDMGGNNMGSGNLGSMSGMA